MAHSAQRPFRRLLLPRSVSEDLPAELQAFYTWHEGVGLSSYPDERVRLAKLNEIRRVTTKDCVVLHHLESTTWGTFSGFLVGIDMFLDKIVLVERAPVCSAGAIMILGPDISGPAGVGHELFEPTIVVGSNFQEWIANLRQNRWFEYGIFPGSVAELPLKEAEKIRSYYLRFNPSLDW